jgi:hypothetical protein
MPLAAPIISGAIIAATPDLPGPDTAKLAAVLGAAIQAWALIPSNVVINGVTTGAIGSGAVLGKLFVPVVPLPVNGAFVGFGFVGTNGQQLARGVGVGVATAFNTSGAYVGVSAGVGAGADVSKITFANPATLTALIISFGAAAGFLGPLFGALAGALGTGIAGLLVTGTGVGSVAGAGGPSPAAGTSISRVV